MFGHVVRGLLWLLKEKWLSETFKTQHNVLDTVCSLWENLHPPYLVEWKISDINYVIQTLDRQRKYRFCHIKSTHEIVLPKKSFGCASPGEHRWCPSSPWASDNGLPVKSDITFYWLENSEILNNLETFVAHPSKSEADIINLIGSNLLLFSCHPRQTVVLAHVFDVEEHKPIKPHACRAKANEKECNAKGSKLSYWTKLFWALAHTVHRVY